MTTLPGFMSSRLAALILGGAASLGFLALVPTTAAHDLSGNPGQPHYDWSVRPPESVSPAWRVARAESAAKSARSVGSHSRSNRPSQAAPFEAFSPRVNLRWDESFLYVESNGVPTHGMMVGITAWQQQVPLPQPYSGENAWRIPLRPVPAEKPVSIRGRFLRGAIALAANGIPIFNPQNNRGEVSQEIGELDQWGGHCGRADDYHYHAAPFHLQKTVGEGQPIAYALDGYPIYGLTDPDGTTPTTLDAFKGHKTAAVGYHYHGSTKYPYVNGGFHGVVVEREGQVDPQPRARGVREALTALRGAKITAFSGAPDEKSYDLRYTVNGRPASVSYAMQAEGVWKFRFTNADGSTREETYRAGDRRGGGGGGGAPPPGGKKGGRRPDRAPPPADRADDAPPREERTSEAVSSPTFRKSGAFALRSSAVGAGGALPVEFTGDGNSSTLPLEWSGAPAGTKSYAVIMHHIDPEGKTKWYWTLYNIPAGVSELPKDVKGVGTLGNNGVNRRVGYAPPHSKGPGEKTYILTAYALSAPVTISQPPSEVNRDVLLAAMNGLVLDSAELKVVYTRTGSVDGDRDAGGRKNKKRST